MTHALNARVPRSLSNQIVNGSDSNCRRTKRVEDCLRHLITRRIHCSVRRVVLATRRALRAPYPEMESA
eukprot:4819681-Lingulodinium_polyedra.AAC.1